MATVSKAYAVWDVEVGDIETVVHSIHEARDYAHRRLAETGNPYGIEQVVLGDDGFPESDGEIR